MEAAFFRYIAETSSDAIWALDLHGRTLWANPALADLLGETPEFVAGLSVFDTLDEVGRGDFARHLESLRRGAAANPQPVEALHRRRDGTSVWTIVSETLLTDDDGTVTGLVHRISDNDERRTRLDELAERQRQLDEAQALARLGSWEWVVATDTLTVSHALKQIFELDGGDHRTLQQWLERLHPDDRVAAAAELERAIAAETAFELSGRHLLRDGGTFWTCSRAQPHRHPDTGQVVRWTGTIRDVDAEVRVRDELTTVIHENETVRAVMAAANTAQNLAEALVRLRAVMLDDPTWLYTRSWVPHPDGSGVATVPFFDEDHDFVRQWPEHAAAEALVAGTAYRTLRFAADDGGHVYAFPIVFEGACQAVLTLISHEPLVDRDRLEVYCSQTATQLEHVLERDASARRLQESRDEALQASVAKSEFLAVMSHEIRTPLNGVLGLNELLLRTPLEPRQRELSSGVASAGRHLLTLINDILDLSKIEAGRLDLEEVDFDVRGVVEGATAMLGGSALAKDVELSVYADADVPEILCGDPTRVAQVVTNLVSNAVKFTEAGQVLVHVTTTAVPARDGNDGAEEADAADALGLRVEVSDTGTGIASDALERIFDDFGQADASTTRVHGGTGLGLAICRKIAQAHHGEIRVRSELGVGSTFTFDAQVRAAGDTASNPLDTEARAQLTGRRVLVVGPARERRARLATQLGLWRPDVVLAADAAEATDVLLSDRTSADPFVAVLVDAPGSDVPDAARPLFALRRLLRDQRVAVLAPDPEAVVARAGLRTPVHRLPFPLTTAALRDVLTHDPGAPRADMVSAAPRLGNRRLLVVEDNPVNQLVAVGMLSALGFEADVAENGQEALDLFDPERHAVVLMDVQMPVLDGYAATRALRARYRGLRLPVVAMTAAAVDGERQRCADAGMDDFLTKPLDLETLGEALARCLVGREPGAAPAPASAATTEQASRASRAADLGPQVLDGARLDALLEMGDGAEVYLLQAIERFLQGTPAAAGEVGAAIDAGDHPRVRQVAHRLAGSALNLGLTVAGEAARAVELCVDAGATDDLPELVGALDAALEDGLGELQRYRAALRMATVRIG